MTVFGYCLCLLLAYYLGLLVGTWISRKVRSQQLTANQARSVAQNINHGYLKGHRAGYSEGFDDAAMRFQPKRGERGRFEKR